VLGLHSTRCRSARIIYNDAATATATDTDTATSAAIATAAAVATCVCCNAAFTATYNRAVFAFAFVAPLLSGDGEFEQILRSDLLLSLFLFSVIFSDFFFARARTQTAFQLHVRCVCNDDFDVDP
jgi:hypothetical protein